MILKIDTGDGWWYLDHVTFGDVSKETRKRKDFMEGVVVVDTSIDTTNPDDSFRVINFYRGNDYFNYAVKSAYLMNDDGKTVDYVGV